MARADLLAWIPEGHPDGMLVGQVNFERLPAHIAIIMVTVIYNDLTRISWIERLMPWRN